MKRDSESQQGQILMKESSTRRVWVARTAIGAAIAAFAIWAPAGCSTSADGQVGAARDEITDDYEAAQRAFNAALPRLEAIQERFEERLFAQEGVTSIGIGLAEDGSTPVFRVVVTSSERAATLPRTVEGVEVRVRVGGPVKLMDGGPSCNGGSGPPCHRDQQPLPVEMGNSGAWKYGTACTLGFKACDLETQSSVLLTNSHCAQYKSSCNLAPIGHDVEHVGPLDQIGGPGVVIGTISGHAAPSCNTVNNYTDATKVASAFFQSSKDHRDIGTPKREVSGPMPGLRVQYSGRTTGHNLGVIEAVNVTVAVPPPNQGGYCCGSLTMKDQISFDPKYPVQGGDSGSGVLVNMVGLPKIDNGVVGLLWGYDSTLAYCNNIDRVLAALDLTLDFTRCGFPEDY